MKTQKSKSKVLIWVTLMLSFVTLLASVSYAWLAGTGSIDSSLVGGSVLTSYFHRGVGTEADPFVITRPVHFYNLIYLYQRLDGFSDEDYFFELGYDLDGSGTPSFYNYADDGSLIPGSYTSVLNMAYYSDGEGKGGPLLPIGTSNTPFNGTFRGNGLTVQNINIIPTEEINGVTYGTCDVGIFGYVNSNATIENVYFKDVSIDLTNADPTVECMGNAVLHDTDSDEQQDLVYVGFVAGHIKTGTTVNSVYINQCRVNGGTPAKSDFGYFGCVEDSDSGEKPEQLGTSVTTIRTAGDEAGFGGSLDMTGLFNRISAILTGSTTTTYPTRETVTAPATQPGRADVVIDQTANIGRSDHGQVNYWSSAAAGTYVGTVSGNNGRYTYIYGLKPEQTTSVTTYTKTGETEPAWYISQNGNYLSVSAEQIENERNQNRAAKWLTDAGNHWYTYINNTVYYLNRQSYDSVVLENVPASNATVWYSDAAEGSLYTMLNSQRYYLIYDGEWGLSNVTEYYRITDGEGHFLNADTSGVSNSGSAEGLVQWQVENTAGGSSFYFISSNTNYYLGFTDRLTVTASPFSWTAEGDSFYCISGGRRFYLTYEDGWRAVMLSGSRISSGSVYLSVSADGLFGTSLPAEATDWLFSSDTSDTQIYTVLNGSVHYLSFNGRLGTSTSEFLWHRSQDSFYCTYGGVNYYLRYENGWEALPEEYRIISDGNGSYLRALAENDFTSVTNEEDATHFYFSSNTANPSGTLAYMAGGELCYLGNNGASFANNAAEWVNDGTHLGVQNTTYYLAFSAGTWQILSCPVYYVISDGADHYLNVNAQYNGVTVGSEETATRWLFSSGGTAPSGTVSVQNGNRTYYLRLNSSTNCNGNTTYTLTVATTPTTWTNNSGILTASGRQITYANGGYTVTTSGTALSFEPYQYLPNALEYGEGSVTAAVTVSSITRQPPQTAVTGPVEKDIAVTFTATEEIMYESHNSTVRRSSYIPIRVAVQGDTDYIPSDPYAVSQKNTGYIIGGTYSGPSTSGQGDIRVSSYGMSEISGSYTANGGFSTIYTFNDSGNSPVAINSQNPGFANYGNVLEKFQEILEKDNNNVFGLHFMNASISTSHIIQAESATIMGNTYVNYEMPESCIDFHLVERGYITFMAGDYYDGNDAFFSLHQIFRDEESQMITAIKEISQVYVSNTQGILAPYIYKYTDGTYTDADIEIDGGTQQPVGYSKVFDSLWITDPTGQGNTADIANSYIYYFEIPCNEGEYALGSVDGLTGAYLLYLDIGSNGGATVDAVVSPEGNEITDSFSVDFREASDTTDYALLQLSFSTPAADFDDFSVLVYFDENDDGGGLCTSGTYSIVINNRSNSDVTVYVFLCDNNNIRGDTYPYGYKLIYSNENNTSVTLKTVMNSEYWKTVAGFVIPHNGAAYEMSYSQD